MNNEESLIQGLRAVAAAEMGNPSSGLEAALLKRLKRRRLLSWPLALEVLAAAAIVAITIFSRSTPVSANEFVAVPYSMPIGPYERADLVRVNVPVAALVQWGLPMSRFDSSQRVSAEVVIGEDGLARAVRVISNP